MERPAIGQQCIVKAVASKYHTFADDAMELKGNKHYPHYTCWGSIASAPFKAYYIGYRVVSVGVTRLEIDGDGEWRTWSYPVYTPEKYKVVWVFVESEKHNPVYAFPEDVAIAAQVAPEG